MSSVFLIKIILIHLCTNCQAKIEKNTGLQKELNDRLLAQKLPFMTEEQWKKEKPIVNNTHVKSFFSLFISVILELIYL
jgi:hypothetical protein